MLRVTGVQAGNTQHFLQVMEMCLCWESEPFCNCIQNWKIRLKPCWECPHARLPSFASWLSASTWGLAKSHPIICQPWIIISFNWLNWGARCKENDPGESGQMGWSSGSLFIPRLWKRLDSSQQSYGSSCVPEGSHLLLPIAIFKVCCCKSYRHWVRKFNTHQVACNIATKG